MKLYHEIRNLQLVSILQKVTQTCFNNKDLQSGNTLSKAITAMANRDHIRLVSSAGGFHLNSSILDPSRLNLEAGSLCHQFGYPTETINFMKCIHPVLSDRALEPPELTLLESVYLGNKVLVPHSFGNEPDHESFEADLLAAVNSRESPAQLSQFAGACRLQGLEMTKPLTTHLLGIDTKMRQRLTSHLKTMDATLNDYLSLVLGERIISENSLLDFQQLTRARRYLSDQVESYQLRQAILCFQTHEVPMTVFSNAAKVEDVNQWYKRELFWKVQEEKDKLREAQDTKTKPNQAAREFVEKTKKQLERQINELKMQVERKVTDLDVRKLKQDEIKSLQEEQRQLKRSLLLDSVLNSRAEITILRVEIERRLITCGVRTLDRETLAIANCLKTGVREIDAHIHPFQQFAVTLYDQVDPNSHLDAVNKCGQVQSFITRLKNRGTEVETLTSGPGYVFTLKDINDCVSTLAKSMIKYAELELRSRCEQAAKKEEWFTELLYCKD